MTIAPHYVDDAVTLHHGDCLDGTRTWHRLADSIAWLYGSGFPKSLDVSKAITATQRHGGANSVRIRQARLGDDYTPSGRAGNRDNLGTSENHLGTDPTRHVETELTPDAEVWQGWGTALKPAFEPVVVGRKPLIGTVAANVLVHGTGALNIDGCRIEGAGGDTTRGASVNATSMVGQLGGQGRIVDDGRGRWPANVVLDESQAEALDEQTGTLTSGANPTRRGSDKFRDAYGDFAGQEECTPARGADSGGASRFLYVAKADGSERVRIDGVAHPTVKPLTLMRWLVRLVTPPGGVVLEPFAGSGTTVEACLLEGVRCIAIEREDEYLPLIAKRIAWGHDPGLRRRETAGQNRRPKTTSEPSLFDFAEVADA